MRRNWSDLKPGDVLEYEERYANQAECYLVLNVTLSGLGDDIVLLDLLSLESGIRYPNHACLPDLIPKGINVLVSQ